jgi:hypothetical protein
MKILSKRGVEWIKFIDKSRQADVKKEPIPKDRPLTIGFIQDF